LRPHTIGSGSLGSTSRFLKECWSGWQRHFGAEALQKS
jgi:hypothetical protein